LEYLGAAFQIQDDIIALTSEDYAKERGIIGEDVHEGKRTLMVIHSLNTDNK
jgi:geranylgeranyl diphosphate synthase type 3